MIRVAKLTDYGIALMTRLAQEPAATATARGAQPVASRTGAVNASTAASSRPGPRWKARDSDIWASGLSMIPSCGRPVGWSRRGEASR